MMELTVSTGALLALLAGTLLFFTKGQSVYTNERTTLDMVQDLRTAFDRFTNEIRMAGSGLPGYRGVISGSRTTLVVRGDFNNVSTTVTSTGAISEGRFPVGSMKGFALGQTVSLLSVEGATAGHAALTKITAIDPTAGTITVNTSDAYPVTAGAQLASFGPGTLINVIERRTYRIRTALNDPNRGAITRKVVYESTGSIGATILAEETLARHVLTEAGNPGLSFTYFDGAGNELPFDPETGLVDQTRVAKVRVDLEARTADRDLQSRKYRTVRLSSLVQVRGQYVPAVGF
jgi:Tfp pilus assembly protein PilW